MVQKRTKVLFVDDDTKLLALLRQLMSNYSGDAWEIFTASDAVSALAIVQEQDIQLVVIDLHMPTISGLQFLKLLQRKFPGLLKVILTADSSDQERGACLDAGAELYLQKPQAAGGWRSIFAALAELLKFQPKDTDTQRVLRAVGVREVLQMECLARNSSVIEVTGDEAIGRLYIKTGQVVHAEAGELKGEEAAFHLLTLSTAETHLRPFTAPENRTINVSWQALLAEAPRWKAAQKAKQPATPSQAGPPPELPEKPSVPASQSVPLEAAPAAPIPTASVEEKTGDAGAAAQPPPLDQLAGPVAAQLEELQPGLRPQIEEMVVCTLRGEVLYSWQCPQVDARINFLEFMSQKARQIAHGLALGKLQHIETRGGLSRTVTRLAEGRAVFVRTTQVPSQTKE